MLMVAVGHTYQRRCRFALAAGSNQYDFSCRQTFQFIDFREYTVRCFKITKIEGDTYCLGHAAPDDEDTPFMFGCRINNLLYT